MPPRQPDSFTTRLLGSMAARGLDRTRLAEAMGTSLPQVSRLCSGHYRPSLETLDKLGNVLGWDDVMRGTMARLAMEVGGNG